MPPVFVVLVDGGAGTVEPGVEDEDLWEVPHPETRSSATVATPMESSLRMRAAY